MIDVMNAGARTHASEDRPFTDSMRGEWTKLRGQRAFRGFLITGMAVAIADCVLKISTTLATGDRAVVRHDSTFVSQIGLLLGAIFFAVAGAMAAAAEYGRRPAAADATRSLTAKAAVVALVGFMAGTVASGTSFLIGRVLLSPPPISVLTAIRVVIGGGVFLALVSVLALATGAVLHNTIKTVSAAMIGLFMAIVFGLSGVLEFLPTAAGANLTTASPQGHTLTAATGLLVMLAWVAAFLLAAIAAQRVRDNS